MSSSDEEASLQEEKWDDMAIVRAFEDAMRGKQSEKKLSPAPKSKTRGRKDASRQKRSVESERESTANQTWSAHGFEVGANGVSVHPHAEQIPVPQAQSQEEIYQAAYAHAYAHLQAQSQPGYYHSQPIPTPTYPPHQGGYSYPPSWNPGMQTTAPPMMPFPSAAGAMPPGFAFPEGSRDDFANLLMSWYQSGYYTGRYQAMQELRSKTSR